MLSSKINSTKENSESLSYELLSPIFADASKDNRPLQQVGEIFRKLMQRFSQGSREK